MSEASTIHGHMTMADGSRVALSEGEARALMDAIEAQDAADEAAMPDTAAALNTLCAARERLRALGWSGGVYCPKDGSEFAIVQFGSSGIFPAWYVGVWPEGSISAGDWSADPEACLWKALDALTPHERERMDRCIADERGFIDRLGRSFGEEGPQP